MSVSAEGPGGEKSSPKPTPRALDSGRAGRIRTALRRAVAEARRSGRMTAEHEVRALLAERYAAAADLANRNGDAAGLLRAGDKLLELLDTLPIRTTGGGESDDSGGDRGKLLTIMDGGPAMGDGSHA